MVIADVSSKGYQKPNGQLISPDEMTYHLHNILNVLYSLSGKEDQVLVEQLIHPMTIIPDLPLKGVPDIRLLLYRGIPAAAMLRLPTFESDGKANLHLGGVGVGVEVSSGKTTSAVHRNRYVREHPEFDISLLKQQKPCWDALLRIACQMAEAIPLGYMGVDLVLDEQFGPLVLEANARPGISIQLANQECLVPRLERIRQDWPKYKPMATVEERVTYCRQLR